MPGRARLKEEIDMFKVIGGDFPKMTTSFSALFETQPYTGDGDKASAEREHRKS